jgi:outer membrane protein
VAVAEETVRNQEKHLMQIQSFVKNGMRPEIDLAQVRTALANAQVQLVGANNNYAVALAELNQAMGLPAQTPHLLADSEIARVDGEDGAGGALAAQALQARPEVAALERQRQAQELTVSALRGGYGPALAATAGATETGSVLDRLVPNWFLGLTLTWPILQGGFTHGQVREARGTLDSISAQADAQRLQVGVEVEQARLAVAASKASIAAAGQALENARDQLRLAEARYTTGLGNAIELDDAQVAFSSARAQEVQARYGLAAARAQLIAALGLR